MAAPIASVYLIQFAGWFVSQTLAGHISADALAAVALANFFFNVVASAPLVGLSFASDSLIPQALAAGNPARAGAIAQLGVAAVAGVSVLVLPLLMFGGAVFDALGQQPAVVALATPYVRLLAIGLPAMALYEMYKKLVNAVGFFSPPLLISASALGVQAAVASALVYGGGSAALGVSSLDGVASAYVVGLWWAALGCAAHLATHRSPVWTCVRRKSGGGAERPARGCCRCTKLDGGGAAAAGATERSPFLPQSAAGAATTAAPDTEAATARRHGESAPPSLPPVASMTTVAMVSDAHAQLDAALAAPLSLASLTNGSAWAAYLSAGLPGLSMLVLEWGSFEALAVIAGTIDAPTQAAHAVLAQLEVTFFAPVLGLAIVASLRAGSFMGTRDAQAARFATRVTLVLVVAYAAAVAVIFGATHAAMGRLFTDDGPTLDLIDKWLPLLCGVIIFDALQNASGGVLRGIGRPIVGALANLGAYLIVGIPLAFVLSRTVGWGLPGLWVGVGLANIVAFTAMGVVLVCMDWGAQAEVVAAEAEAGKV